MRRSKNWPKTSFGAPFQTFLPGKPHQCSIWPALQLLVMHA
jgi:hypothetical protein